jgi:hypothetical protein
LLCPARQLPLQLCAVTLEFLDLRCGRRVCFAFGFKQLHCAQNALFESLKIRCRQGFGSLIADIHRYRCHTSSLLGEFACSRRSISPMQTGESKSHSHPVHMCALIDNLLTPQLCYARNLPPSDSSALTMLFDQECSSSSRSVRSGDWNVVETSME